MSVPAPANQTNTSIEGTVAVTGVYAVTELAAASSGAASQITATLTGSATTTVYLTGFVVDGLGATGASVIAVTVSGLLGGSQVYRVTIPAGATTAISRLVVEFAKAVPASAVNTPIVVTVPSFGAGNTVANVSVSGFHR